MWNNNLAFKEELSRVITSAGNHRCIRAVLVATRDREYAMNLVKEITVYCKQHLYHFTVACRRRYRTDHLSFETSGVGSQDPAELLRRVMEIKGGGVIIIEDLAPCLKDQTGDRNARVQLSLMLSSDTIIDEGIVLVFIEPPESESLLPGILDDQFNKIDVPMPRVNELETIASKEIAVASHKNGKKIDVTNIKVWGRRLADGLVGLTHTGARNALRDVLSKNPADFELAEKTLIERKANQLSRELSMNILNNSNAEIPIGLDCLYEYLSINKEIIGVSRPDRAKGILLLGPPGTGKTMLAKAIGKIVNLPVVEFRISALMNSLLGETERRFEQAFAVFDAMAPVVIFIDEIEKAFGEQGGENDGGTMMRCTGRLLTWLSDSPSPNFIVATANNVKRMGEIGMTMTRRGRFDRAFLVDVPSRKARIDMLTNWLKPHIKDMDEVAQRLSEKTEHFSGADLKGVVDDARSRARYMKESLGLKHLECEVERNRLRVEAIYGEFRKLRDFARLFAEPAGYEGE
ncbi:AAA family ATPase [bacterium]|nr:AAA family ATPase [bacterium]MBU1753090.1 AAA family ATPase [bacterium]